MTAENPSRLLELEERLRFETLIADLSSEFVNLPSGERGPGDRRCPTPRLRVPWTRSVRALAVVDRVTGIACVDPPLSIPGRPADSRSDGCPGVFSLVRRATTVRQSDCRFVGGGNATRGSPRPGGLSPFRHQEHSGYPARGGRRSADRRIGLQHHARLNARGRKRS